MMLIIGVIAVLLFGERLPEVARSVGKGFMELKKGVRSIQEEVEGAINSATTSTDDGCRGTKSRRSAKKRRPRSLSRHPLELFRRVALDYDILGRLAQLVRAPSSHGGSRRFESFAAHSP